MLFPLYDMNPHRRIPWVTLLLIAANLAVAYGMSKLPPPGREDVAARWGFIPKRVEQLSNPKLVVEVKFNRPNDEPQAPKPPGRVIRLAASPAQIYTTMITMMFLHGGLFHLIVNMWFLWIFGNNIEDRLGHFIFLAFYLLGGLLANACHWAIEPGSAIPVIGASGAVAAVLGAYAITYPKAKVRTLVFLFVFARILDLPAVIMLGAWFAIQLIAGFLSDAGGVAWWAHIGGFVAGLLLMPLMTLAAPPPDTDWIKEAKEQFEPIENP